MLALAVFDVLKEPEMRSTLIALIVVTLAHAGAASAAGATSGAMLYRRYCASCHGATGRGDGPVGAELRVPPADLTGLKSSVSDLMRQIDGRNAIRAHGTSKMPVWGEVFEESLLGEPYRRRTALQKVQMLAEYVRSLRKE